MRMACKVYPILFDILNLVNSQEGTQVKMDLAWQKCSWFGHNRFQSQLEFELVILSMVGRSFSKLMDGSVSFL